MQAAADAASHSLRGQADLGLAIHCRAATRAHERVLFDRKWANMVVAASIRVTIRAVTAAEVRPMRAPRTPEG